MRTRLVIVGLFIVAAGLLWLPFHTQTALYGTKSTGSTPAGQITANFNLVQTVVPDTQAHVAGQQQCFGIRFATYARTNSGTLAVIWKQADHTQRWDIATRYLADNTYRYFCPDAPFDALQPFELRVRGVDGRSGHSATLWLVSDTHLGTARLGDDKSTGKALALRVATRERHGSISIARIDRGAFVIGWLCTLLVGSIALWFAFTRKRKAH